MSFSVSRSYIVWHVTFIFMPPLTSVSFFSTQAFVAFDDLCNFERNEKAIRDLSAVCLSITWNLWFGGGGPQKYSVHLLSTSQGYMTLVWMLSITMWLQQCLSGFPTVKLLYPHPFSVIYFLARSAQPTSLEVKVTT